jgi:hypothetical protein
VKKLQPVRPPERCSRCRWFDDGKRRGGAHCDGDFDDGEGSARIANEDAGNDER